MSDPKAIVRTGYDQISYAYRADDAPDQPYRSWLQLLDSVLPTNAAVLDLGCGCGIPATRILAEQYQVTGVDLSSVQIERARNLVPQAQFVCADMTQVEFLPHSFAAIVCLYAIIHVPLEEQPQLLDRMLAWLQPEGYLLIIVGHGACTDTEEDWLGVSGGTMYWSHTDSSIYKEWLTARGCTIAYEQFIPEEDTGHVLLLVRLIKRAGMV